MVTGAALRTNGGTASETVFGLRYEQTKSYIHTAY